MNACEYLSRVGFEALLDIHIEVDEYDPEATEDFHIAANRRVRDRLLSTSAKTLIGRPGVSWITKIDWPDRIPSLNTWAGSLSHIITRRQEAIEKSQPDDLFDFRCPIKGVSGIDSLACRNSLDVGFSTYIMGTPVIQRPGRELLAIYGLQVLPLISFSSHVCGFVNNGKLWQFPVEEVPNVCGCHYQLGEVEEVNLANLTSYWKSRWKSL